jgi:hypothetical protein
LKRARDEYELNRIRKDLERYESSSRTHSRSRPPAPPAPVIINNTRSYNDYEDDDYLELAPPRSRSRSRSRHSGPGLLPEPVIINNPINIASAYTGSDDGDSQYLTLEHRALALNRRLQGADLDGVTQAYSFSLSRHTKNSESTRSISGSVSETSEQSEPAQEEPLKVPSSSGRTHNILRSHYVGDGIVTGRHTVELTVTAESDPSRQKGVSPIFRWVSGCLASSILRRY